MLILKENVKKFCWPKIGFFKPVMPSTCYFGGIETSREIKNFYIIFCFKFECFPKHGLILAIFAQHYSPKHNGVYIQNVGYCGFLCVSSSGKVYSNVSIHIHYISERFLSLTSHMSVLNLKQPHGKHFMQAWQVRAASESSLNLGFFERIRMVKPYPGGKLL